MKIDNALLAANSKLDVMVVSFTGDSGLTDYSVSLCKELGKLVSVQLVTAECFDHVKYAPDFPVVKPFRRTRHFPLDFFKFVAHVLRMRPRIVLFQSWLKSPLFELPWVLLFRACGIRVALTVHDLLPHYPRPWSKFECSVYYRCFDSLIVHSHKQREGLWRMGVTKLPLVVPHGVYDLFNTRNMNRETARAFFPDLDADTFVILFFGHLDERKGLTDFLDAASLLNKDCRFKFVVAGKPDGRAATQAALNSARGKANVLIHDFLIPHDEVQRYFAACDVAALPYREGTTSGVMKLAMAFKKPVVCTDVGDFSESLSMWTGVLIDRQTLPASLAEGVVRAREDYQALIARTDSLAEDIQWPNIALKYVQHIRAWKVPSGVAR